ncbi:MAG: hypothetical protein AAFQ51_16920 [Pseudomonadota bacterium]
MDPDTLLAWAIGLVAGALPFTVAAARRRRPNPNDMRPDAPLNEAAATFVAGISLASLMLLALTQAGIVIPAALALGLLAGHVLLRGTALLFPLYRLDRLLAVASVLATAYLWTSFVSMEESSI